MALKKRLLTHWSRDQMAAILAHGYFQIDFLCANCFILIQISSKLVLKGSVNTVVSLVQVMAYGEYWSRSAWLSWYRIDDALLPVTAGTSSVHYDDVIMTTMASQITSLAVVYSIVYSGIDLRKHQSSAWLAFVRGIHRDRWIPRTRGQ